MPDLNVLINNAGFQRRIFLASDNASWTERQSEIDTLFSGPIHLNHLLIPVMLAHKNESLIVNVTSGGAYIPQVFAPIYSASKAALHNYTMSLRYSLAGTDIKVAELIPPAVKTQLAGNADHGADLDKFCDKTFFDLMIDNLEKVGFGLTDNLEPQLSGIPVETLFESSAKRFPIVVYRSPDL